MTEREDGDELKKIKQVLSWLDAQVKTVIMTDSLYRRILFYFMCTVLSLTSFVMTVVNVFTAEYLLMAVTLIFSLLCLSNILLLACHVTKESLVYWVFGVETLMLLFFFVMTGVPDGFSVLWCALVPSFALLVFGTSGGSMFSVLTLAMLVFLFWIPAGKQLLQYEYSSVFMLRFPFFYASAYLLSLVIEYVRNKTKKQLETAKQEYEYLYRHDALTGLYNRYGIEESFEKGVCGKLPEHISVIMFDIDKFKEVNDLYGHAAGDEVLKTVAAISYSVICEHCDCCRWGGEEFLLVIRCEQDAYEIAETLRYKIESTPTVYCGRKIFVTASFGVCVGLRYGTTDEIFGLIDKADKAMYEAKANGRNCVIVTP